MSKTLVSTIISDVKVFGDYSIQDTNLDAMILKAINYSVRKLRNWFIGFNIFEDVTTEASFKTIAGQEYIDLTLAHIVGNASTFTGTAGDTVTVTIDGTAYAGIDLSAATDIADVVTAINTGVGSTVASEDDNGYLMITSLTAGTTSAVTIADTAGTATDSLFEADSDKTQSAITDLDDVLRICDRVNDKALEMMHFQQFRLYFPDPDSNSGSSPDFASRLNNYIYFAPSPSAARLLYFSYYKMMADLVSTDTMPYTSEYDELVVALCLEWIYLFFDSKDRSSMLTIREKIELLKRDLIVKSPKRINYDNQVAIRGEGWIRSQIAPRFAE